MPRTSLTDILLGTTSLTPEQLTRAQALSTQKGVRLEEVLVQQRFLGEEELLQAQGQQLGMPYWKELPESEFDVSLMAQIPLQFARQHQAHVDGLPVWRERPEHVRKNTIARVPPMPVFKELP